MMMKKEEQVVPSYAMYKAVVQHVLEVSFSSFYFSSCENLFFIFLPSSARTERVDSGSGREEV